jgi:hypothetical protein
MYIIHRLRLDFQGLGVRFSPHFHQEPICTAPQRPIMNGGLLWQNQPIRTFQPVGRVNAMKTRKENIVSEVPVAPFAVFFSMKLPLWKPLSNPMKSFALVRARA